MATLKRGTRIRRNLDAVHSPGQWATITSHVRSAPHHTEYEVRLDKDGELAVWRDTFFQTEEALTKAAMREACAELSNKAVESLPDDSNPKDAVAQLKVDLSLIPEVFSAHVADALMDGAKKYGPYNWRDKKVQARVYVAAAKRHLAAWSEREETAEDSGAHHLGHAAACLAIILDAQHHGCLLDNRPANSGKRMQDLFDQINKRRADAIDFVALLSE